MWQDSTLSSPPGKNRQLSPNFGVVSLLNYTVNTEKKENNPREKTQRKSSGNGALNCRMLSLVVVERVLNGRLILSSAGTGEKGALPMTLPNPSPVLDKKIVHSTGARVWRKAPKAFPDSSSVLETNFSLRWKFPAYSGALLLTIDHFSFFYLQLEFFCLQLAVLAFLLTIGVFCLQWESASNKILKGL